MDFPVVDRRARCAQPVILFPLAQIIEHTQCLMDLRELRTSEEQGLCVFLGAPATWLLWSGGKSSSGETPEELMGFDM